MHISIIGCEHFKDYQVLKWHLDDLHVTRITTCGENEIERLAERYARENNIPLEACWPRHQKGRLTIWKEYYRIIEKCEILIAFWYGESSSIPCMIRKAKRMARIVKEVRGFLPGNNISNN
ncbi:hypothetical protein EL17_23875 [Anditalea andensis]|uniref:DUF4062 domain-containing protein n=2 Tax=Anditalea andensis TaxID=1048983 RepID=A0A074LP35_9BACT|nr:hypothetical protein EL17_23875 [Anditalea andensis]